jgi:hypothetical protein
MRYRQERADFDRRVVHAFLRGRIAHQNRWNGILQRPLQPLIEIRACDAKRVGEAHPRIQHMRDNGHAIADDLLEYLYRSVVAQH